MDLGLHSVPYDEATGRQFYKGSVQYAKVTIKSDIDIPANYNLKLTFGPDHLIMRGTALLSSNVPLFDASKLDFVYSHSNTQLVISNIGKIINNTEVIVTVRVDCHEAGSYI